MLERLLKVLHFIFFGVAIVCVVYFAFVLDWYYTHGDRNGKDMGEFLFALPIIGSIAFFVMPVVIYIVQGKWRSFPFEEPDQDNENNDNSHTGGAD